MDPEFHLLPFNDPSGVSSLPSDGVAILNNISGFSEEEFVISIF